jgi:hypothetical protein
VTSFLVVPEDEGRALATLSHRVAAIAKAHKAAEPL